MEELPGSTHWSFKNPSNIKMLLGFFKLQCVLPGSSSTVLKRYCDTAATWFKTVHPAVSSNHFKMVENHQFISESIMEGPGLPGPWFPSPAC